MKTVTDYIFLGCKTLLMVTAAVKLRLLLLGKKTMTKLDHIKKQTHHFADKDPNSQSCGFSSIHVWM